MKIVVFGHGKFYEHRKHLIPESDEIIAFLDNDALKQASAAQGIPVLAPEQLGALEYDSVVIMSVHAAQMREQLSRLGVPSAQVLGWKEYLALSPEAFPEESRTYLGQLYRNKNRKKKVLILSTYIDYTGAPMAAISACMALEGRGYEAVLAAEGCDPVRGRELSEEGIRWICLPSLPVLPASVLEAIAQFDYCLVNTFVMGRAAAQLAGILPTLWWLHEASLWFEKTRRDDPLPKEAIPGRVSVRAVSEIPGRIFTSLYPDIRCGLLPYGLPDFCGMTPSERNCCTDPCRSTNGTRLVFAVIGTVEERKGQDIFIEAIRRMKYQDRADFMVVGQYNDTEYVRGVLADAAAYPNITFTGVLPRSRIHELFRDIDVLVCPSREDPLPITVTEGFMNHKLCIVSTGTGTAGLIHNGTDGFVFRSGNAEELAGLMDHIVQAPEQCADIGDRGREIYEDIFSMDSFADRLETAFRESAEM